MTCRVLILGAILTALACASASAADPVAEKLEKAKKTYAAELEKFQKDVAASLDKREEAARKAGDKKLVDQIKAERKAFDEKGEVPSTTPKVVRQRLATARATLEKAYESAIRDYTKAKNDTEAASVEKELAVFKKEGDPSDSRRKWVHDKGSFTLQGAGMWEEKGADGNTYKWKETARTKAYVELQAEIFGVEYTARLTDSSADYRSGKETAFKKKFTGKWTE
jgi:hypothetical protein